MRQISEIKISIEDTPNPCTKKFLFSKVISEKTVEFKEALEAAPSPLAMKIFGFPWAESVMIGPNFVSVSKQDWVDWEIIQEPLSQILLDHIKSGEDIITSSIKTEDENSVLATDSDEVKTIKNVLNQYIRPAVMMDGGDVIFKKYEDRILYLDLIGACSGCPSSTQTLKGGVERILKKYLPDIAGVVAI